MTGNRKYLEGDIFVWKSVKFGDIKDNEIFYCYGDQYINYTYPAWCECIKLSSHDAEEVNGMRFYIYPDDLVSVINSSRCIINITTDMYKKYRHLNNKDAYEAIIRDSRDSKIKEIFD